MPVTADHCAREGLSNRPLLDKCMTQQHIKACELEGIQKRVQLDKAGIGLLQLMQAGESATSKACIMASKCNNTEGCCVGARDRFWGDAKSLA